VPPSLESLRRVEALARDAGASDEERATAERIAAKLREEFGPDVGAAGEGAEPWAAKLREVVEGLRRRAEDDRHFREELERGLHAVPRAAPAGPRARPFNPVGQWGPGYRRR
jgi:hypothetical protein